MKKVAQERARAAKRKKRIIIISVVSVLAVLLITAGVLFYVKVSGHKGTVGSCSWTLSNDGVMTVSGTGSTKGKVFVTFGLGKCSLDDVKEVVIEEGVTDVYAPFIKAMTNLTKVTVPSSVNDIEDGTFTSNKLLSSIVVAEGNTNFSSLDGSLYDKSQTKLICYPSAISNADFVVPGSVEEIATYAFKDVSSLVTVRLNSGLIVIDDLAFVGVPNLKSIDIDDSNESYISDGKVLYDQGQTTVIRVAPSSDLTSVELPDTVTQIGDAAFEGCSSITSVVLNDRITRIGVGAFNGCSGLTEITIPEGCRRICDGVFAKCTSLKSVTLPSEYTSIPSNLFWGCTSLTSVTIPETVTSIGDGAFCNCTSLTQIDIPVTVTAIGSNAFGGCIGLASIELPEGLAAISDYAFNKCTALKEITIPESVSSVGYAAFADCKSLTAVTVPDGVTSIGDFAFFNCSGLSTVNLGRGIKTIGEAAFKNCTALGSIFYAGSQADWAGVSVGSDNDKVKSSLQFK